MLEKFTVDAVATEIVKYVRSGQLSPKLTHRFLRKGRWAGRKGHDHQHIEDVLTSAVDVACSKIAEDYLARRQALMIQIQGLETQAASAASRAQAARDEAAQAPGTSESDPPSSPATSAPRDVENGQAPHGSGTQAPVGGPPLDTALEALRRSQERAIEEERRAEERAARERAEAERKATEERADQAAQTLSQAQVELSELPTTYRQRVESAHSAGRTLWARYCDGYDIGLRRRGAPELDNDRPLPEIDFDVPTVLTDAGPVPGGEQPVPAPVAVGAVDTQDASARDEED